MAELLRLLLVDDEPLALRRLESLVKKMESVEIVGMARDGDTAIEESRRLRPDLAIVDVEMPGRNGLSAAAVMARENTTEVVILSAFDRYAVTAFEVEALDYLLKPLRPDRLEQALDRARYRRSEKTAYASLIAEVAAEERQVIHIPDRNGGRDLPLKEIVWIEAARDYALFHTRARTHIMRITMGGLTSQLPASLMRVHRSAFVAISQVRRWGVPQKGIWCLVMSDDTEVPVGPSYIEEVRAVLRSLTL